jgi:glycosyltransferase involved in cell wall biosynthesis
MLSIIIPTLNEENYLPLLLESIKKQTRQNSTGNSGGQDFNDYEIIVSDNNSADKTVEIAKNYGCKIVRGGLPGKGRNEGAKVAQGDLLLFLDADTILPEGSLEKLLNEFKERKLSVASSLVKPREKSFIFKIIYYLFYNFIVSSIEKFRPCAMSFILIKKTLHERIGGFDEKIKFGEDADYVRRASKFGNFAYLKSEKILISVRRFYQDGWFLTCLRYTLAGLYLVFFGPIKSDILKYKFGHYKKIRE